MIFFAILGTIVAGAFVAGAWGVFTIGRDIRRSLADIRNFQESQSACAVEQVKIASGSAAQMKWRA